MPQIGKYYTYSGVSCLTILDSEPPATNAMINGSFEDDLDTWSTSGHTEFIYVIYDEDEAYDGIAYLLMEIDHDDEGPDETASIYKSVNLGATTDHKTLKFVYDSYLDYEDLDVYLQVYIGATNVLNLSIEQESWWVPVIVDLSAYSGTQTLTITLTGDIPYGYFAELYLDYIRLYVSEAAYTTLYDLQCIRPYVMGDKLYVVGVGGMDYMGQYTLSTDYNIDWNYTPTDTVPWTNHGMWLDENNCLSFFDITKMGNGNVLLTGGIHAHAGSLTPTSHQYYTSDGYTWNQMSDAPWPARYKHKVIWHDNALWLIGGASGTYAIETGFYPEDALGDIWKSTNYGSSWTQITPSGAHGARWDGGAISYDDMIFIWGGIYGAYPSWSTRPYMAWSTDGLNWTARVASAVAGTFCAGGSVIFQDALCFYGGLATTQSPNIYSTRSGMTFTTMRALPTSGIFLGYSTSTLTTETDLDSVGFINVDNDYVDPDTRLLMFISKNFEGYGKMHRIR